MKKVLFALTLSIVLALGSQPAFAQAKKKTTAPADAPAAAAPKATDAEKAKTDRPIPYSGDVAAVDASAKTITLKAKDPTKQRVLRVSDTTAVVSVAGETETPAKLSEVKADAYITGTYRKAADGSLEAVKVKLGMVKTVRAPKPKAEGDAKPKK